MAESEQILGLIAGNRALPLVFARQARSLGAKRLACVAFEGETNPDLASLVDEMVWIKVGQLGKLIDVFHEWGVTRCVMLGQITPRNLFDLRPDFRTVRLLLKLKEKNAQTIFAAVANELHNEGIELVEATPWLRPLMPGPDFLIGPKLGAEQREDVSFAFRIAKEISRLEIGQTVVAKAGTVLAVEGFEGTDACLKRGGGLAGPDGGGVAVKVAKEQHDMRFDIPCVGFQTLESCAEARIAALALEADKTLLLDRERIEGLARQHKITVLTVGGENPPT